MPKQINTPNPGQRLVGLFGLKGRFQPVLDEVIVPVVDVGAQEVNERHCSAEASTGAAAGEFSCARLSNFDLSTLDWTGKIAVVDRVTIRGATAQNYYFLIGGTWTLGSLTAGVKGYTDSAYAGQSPLASITYGTTTFDNAASSILTKWVATGGVSINLPGWVISNGVALFVQADTANQGFDISIEWYERDVIAATS